MYIRSYSRPSLPVDRNAAGCGVDEAQYVFIKRVCQVLVELGTSQIARLWV